MIRVHNVDRIKGGDWYCNASLSAFYVTAWGSNRISATLRAIRSVLQYRFLGVWIP